MKFLEALEHKIEIIERKYEPDFQQIALYTRDAKKILTALKSAKILAQNARWDALDSNEPYLPGYAETVAAFDQLEKE